MTDQPGADMNPAAALQGDRLWLFWQTYDPAQPPAGRHWRISFATRTGTTWTAPAIFGDAATQRRLPAAVADNTGGLWLFWLERMSGTWQLRYNRHDGTDWQLAAPAVLPLDNGQAPRVEDDLYVLFHPASATQRLWLFWARHEPGGPPGQSRWSIVYRIKQGLNPAAADWSPIRPLPKTSPSGYHDRQPAALLSTAGDIEVFWSSTQHGGWSVVLSTLAVGTLTWGAGQQVAVSPYSQRAPLAMDAGPGTLLVLPVQRKHRVHQQCLRRHQDPGSPLRGNDDGGHRRRGETRAARHSSRTSRPIPMTPGPVGFAPTTTAYPGTPSGCT